MHEWLMNEGAIQIPQVQLRLTSSSLSRCTPACPNALYLTTPATFLISCSESWDWESPPSAPTTCAADGICSLPVVAKPNSPGQKMLMDGTALQVDCSPTTNLQAPHPLSPPALDPFHHQPETSSPTTVGFVTCEMSSSA